MRAVVLAAAALAGCASVSDMYASPVDATVVSPKPLQEVSSCLQLKYATAPLVAPGGETMLLLKNIQQVTIGILTLSTVPEGTKIEMRRSRSVGALGDWRSCA